MTEPEPTNEAKAPTPWTPPDGPPPAEVERAAHPDFRLVAGLALVLIIVLALIGTAPFWAPALMPVLPWGSRAMAGENAALAALRTRLDGDEATLKKATARSSQRDGDSGAMRDLTARVARLETRPAPAAAATPPVAAPKSPPPAADTAALKALEGEVAKLTAASAAAGDKLTKLEAQFGAVEAKDQAERTRLLALANLRVSVEGSGPYAAELAGVEALAADQAKTRERLAPLAADAKAGLPSLADLTERFDRRVAPAILRAGGATPSGDFGDEVLARLRRLVVIRRIGPGAPLPHDPVEAAVVRAEDALRTGDLAAAVTALGHLPDASAKAAAPWLADARRRVAAGTLLDQLWRDETARAATDRPGGAKP
jgi:hypothetical protein